MSPPDERGRTGHFHANIEGELSADRETARGRDGDVVRRRPPPVVTCESGHVRWGVRR